MSPSAYLSDQTKNSDNRKKKSSNIGIKLADIECQMTGQNVQPLASNKNPERGLRINQVRSSQKDTFYWSKILKKVMRM